MRFGERVGLTRSLDGKVARSVTALQIAEPGHGKTTGPRGKLQQSGLAFIVESLQPFPEPLDHLVLRGVVAIVGELFPIVHIDLRNAADQQL